VALKQILEASIILLTNSTKKIRAEIFPTSSAGLSKILRFQILTCERAYSLRVVWPAAFSYPEPFLRAVRRGALAKSITGYHKNMVRKQCTVLELANQMPVRNMDLARAPRRTARKKGSGYENGPAEEVERFPY
jgi:hypothetical protein